MYQALIKLVKIPSVNEAHKIGRAGNRTWMYLNPVVSNMQDTIKDQLIRQSCPDYFKSHKDMAYEVELIFVIKDNFWVRDTTNLVKYCEDAISKASGINDALNIRVCERKVQNDLDEFEYIAIVINEKPRSQFQITWSSIINAASNV